MYCKAMSQIYFNIYYRIYILVFTEHYYIISKWSFLSF